MKPAVHGFFDVATNTITYVVVEPEGRACAVIDSVLDFDQASGRTDTRSADAVVEFIRDQGLRLEWVGLSALHPRHVPAGRRRG